MIEKLQINNQEVWIQIDPHPVERDNMNIIPTEYFTASYYKSDPQNENSIGILMKEFTGAVKLFESPVAALEYAGKALENAT